MRDLSAPGLGIVADESHVGPRLGYVAVEACRVLG